MIYRLKQMKIKFAWDYFMHLRQQNNFPSKGSLHKIDFNNAITCQFKCQVCVGQVVLSMMYFKALLE